MNEMSVYEAILGRRSIREYTAQKVDAKKIRSLVEAAVMAPTAMGNEPWAFAIIICANKDNPTAVADCWLAAENLMLAALAMGLGTCLIGAVLLAMHDEEQKIKLGIPADYEAIVPIIVGFPRGTVVSSKRKRPLILNWVEGQTSH